MRRLLVPLLLPFLLSSTPLPPAASDLLRVAVLSDINGSYGSLSYPSALKSSLSRIINTWKPDVVLSAGDLIAGQKASLTDANVRGMWASFDREVRGPLAKAGIPFVFTLGNHDASLARDRREAAAYWTRFAPAGTVVDAAQYPFRYSLTRTDKAGRTLFIAVLDASGPKVDATQRAWLAAQLVTPQARAAGVRLVVGHLPLAGVSEGKNKPGEVITEAAPLREVMERGRVLAYISGHHAAYYPAKLGNLNVLSSGGIGGRDYVGFPGTARSVVSVLDIDVQAGTARLHAVDADTGAAVDPNVLPARIGGLGGPLVRVEEFR
ncbi:metallophosphoesterase [Deinococcus sp. Arct2-2]|uniref:metallophosphoesterase family protein n=1 Tax=Deinococcus sp. Arct2-2 TaxID=2568653 RepID=UPI0010A3B882|nr:metallophosphoesterase [Deinococcus sp. Arct2-2]THF71189.1 metallophosphoesterase [Deinococcus sp. Arct2-2]